MQDKRSGPYIATHGSLFCEMDVGPSSSSDESDQVSVPLNKLAIRAGV